MAEQDARGALTVARQEGRLEGKREASLRLLERSGIALTEEDHAKIAACADAATLDRGFDLAPGARTITEVFV